MAKLFIIEKVTSLNILDVVHVIRSNCYRKWCPCNVTGKCSQLFIQCALCTTRNALRWKGEKKVKAGLVI